MRVYRVGLDPEVALIHRKYGTAISAHRFINRKRQFTFSYGSQCVTGSEVDRDGAALEVRSLVNSACRDNIVPYVAEALRQTRLQLKDFRGGGYTLGCPPMYRLNSVSFKGGRVPDDVMEFGCRPDMDAYTLQPKDPILDPSDKRRWTGGHIHFGLESDGISVMNDVTQQASLAILFDYFIGVPSVAVFGERYAAGEAERREFYGQPGSFRWDAEKRKIEYRTLSGRLLLHPTLLYYFIGLGKVVVHGLRSESPRELLRRIADSVDTGLVYNIIMSHDVSAAEKLIEDGLFELLPTYRADRADLSNPHKAGGYGVLNPFFYEQATRVFVAGNHAGIGFRDDMEYNWGLYEDYAPTHHAYWGIQQAMVGQCDDDIFPYNHVLTSVWPEEFVTPTPVYKHPLNGGDAPMHGSAGWLR